jgi:hypothetical protein
MKNNLFKSLGPAGKNMDIHNFVEKIIYTESEEILNKPSKIKKKVTKATTQSEIIPRYCPIKDADKLK